MKKTILSLVLIAAIAGVYGFKSFMQPKACNPTALKKMLGEMLGEEFIPDGLKLTKITYKPKPQKKLVEIPLYMGEYYKIIFYTAELPQDIDIDIYNKPESSKRRKLLFSSKESSKNNENTYVFETDRADNFYIEYSIPGTDTIKSGCISFMLGYAKE